MEDKQKIEKTYQEGFQVWYWRTEKVKQKDKVSNKDVLRRADEEI